MRRMLPVLVAAAVVALGYGSPASAHGQLAFSDPAHQSTVTAPLERVALYFTEKPGPEASFSVTSPGGQRIDKGWSHGEPRRLDKPVQELVLRDGKWEPQVYQAGFPAMVATSHWPERGVYTIKYLTVASDGDRVAGEIRFDYQGPTTAAPGPLASSTAAAKPSGGASWWIVALIAAVALVTAFVLIRRVRRP